MKKLLLSIFIAMYVNAYSQTTLEEWNYITKGYKIQVESGLDMKKGYELKELNTYIYSDVDGTKRHHTFKELIKKDTNKVAAIMVELFVIYKGKKSEIKYFCIPTKNSSFEINDLFLKQANRFTALNAASAYTWALSKLLSDNYIIK